MSKAPHFVFFEPRIPGNTGNAMRLAACTGSMLHLIEPLGFELDDKRLKRAGLDYHDLAHYEVHSGFDAFVRSIPEGARIFAFSSHGTKKFTDVKYQSSDYLLFGPEPSGLPQEILSHPRITETLTIPMLESVRSLNLAVCASISVYEAWRQMGFE